MENFCTLRLVYYYDLAYACVHDSKMAGKTLLLVSLLVNGMKLEQKKEIQERHISTAREADYGSLLLEYGYVILLLKEIQP